MCHYSETTNPKDGAEIQNLIYTNTDYFSLFSECGSYGSDKFFSNSPTLESYSTDTTSSSPILPNEDHFFKSNEINVMVCFDTFFFLSLNSALTFLLLIGK
jgi:hypothetical protein